MNNDRKALDIIEEWEDAEYKSPSQKKARLQSIIKEMLDLFDNSTAQTDKVIEQLERAHSQAETAIQSVAKLTDLLTKVISGSCQNKQN